MQDQYPIERFTPVAFPMVRVSRDGHHQEVMVMKIELSPLHRVHFEDGSAEDFSSSEHFYQYPHEA